MVAMKSMFDSPVELPIGKYFGVAFNKMAWKKQNRSI